MIEITHAQARRLLSNALDSRQDDPRRLPDEQWAVLQAHLEHCADCRAYAGHLRGLEKNLRRASRAVFDAVPGPELGLARQVMQTHQGRKTAQRRAWSTALALLLALALLTGSLGRGLLTAAPDAGSLAEAGLVDNGAASLPIAAAGSFPAVVAFEARSGSPPNSDIFLLNPGSAPVNLTDHPAEDTQPAWSPDGEWLAFLSDRGSPGKPEVFVLHLASSRLVQLTIEAEIRWAGPLSWAADGHTIALTGVRLAAGDQSWIYLVPVDGSRPNARPVALAGTRGAYEPEFSPAGRRLAYVFKEGEHSGVALHHLGTGEQAKASWISNPRAASPPPGAQFDWAADGSGLAYIASDPLGVASLGGVPDSGVSAQGGGGGSQVWAVSELNYSIGLFYEYTRNERIARSRWPGAYRAVTWSPSGSVVYLEDLADARAQDQPGQVNLGCQMVQARAVDPSERTFSFGGLCVEGGLDSGSWTADGRWLVVLGRLPDERQLSIYALRLPGVGEVVVLPGASMPGASVEPAAADDFGTVLRLAADPRSTALPRVRPRLEKSQPPLEIDPGESRGLSFDPRPSVFSAGPDGPQGHIVYEVQNNNRSVLVSTNPSGTGGQVLLSSTGRLRCPVWSPDGQRLALVARPKDLEGQGAGEELFVVEPGGGAARQVSGTAQLAGIQHSDFVDFGCPAWSPSGAPGGPALAALVYDPDVWRVAVITPPGAAKTERYATVGRPPLNAPVIWSPDGRRVYLAAAPPEGGRARMLAVDLPETAASSLSVRPLASGELPGNIMTYALSPDGEDLIVLVRPEAGPGKAQLWRVAASADRAPQMLLELGDPLPLPEIRRGLLNWSREQVLHLALTSGPLEREKTLLLRIDLSRDRSQAEVLRLAGVEDELHSLSWSPDGDWAVISTEGGLWGVDLRSAALGLAAPAWLSPVPVEDLDWR